jgi:hypothetical protein
MEEEVLHKWAGCGVTSTAMVRIIDRWERLRWNSVQNTHLENETGVQSPPFSEPKRKSRLRAKVHEIPAAELNLIIESMTRLAKAGSAVESLHINVESVFDTKGVVRAA